MDSFTYKRYVKMLQKAITMGYSFQKFRFTQQHENNKVCFLRHDVDNSPEAALLLAKYEQQLGISSTFFFMLASEAYNCLSPMTKIILRELIGMGHEVALHFSEIAYDDLANLPDELWRKKLIHYVQKEVAFLADILGQPIYAVSFHQPSERICMLKPELPRLVNTYRPEDLGGPFYLSDSCMGWRSKQPEEVFEVGQQSLQLLLHPMWWREDEGTLFERWQLVLKDRICSIWDTWKTYESTVPNSWETPFLKEDNNTNKKL